MAITNNIPFIWHPVDLRLAVKNWGQNRAGTQVRVGNFIKPYESLMNMVNHLCMFHPRVLFSRGHSPNNYQYTFYSNGENYYSWLINDVWNNNKTYEVKIIYQLGYPVGGDGYGMFYDGYFGSDNRSQYFTGSGLLDDTGETGWDYVSFIVNKENITNEKIETGIVSYNTSGNLVFTILDICVQEIPNTWADETYTICRNNLAKSNDVVTDTAISELNSTFHELRTNCLPIIFSWSGMNVYQGYQPTVDTQKWYVMGIGITSPTFINIQDFTSTSRTATTPGFLSHCYKGGRGLSPNVRVRCNVYAKCADAYDGYMRFIGPDHRSNNYADIQISGTDYDWFDDYDSATSLYLNADSLYGDETTERNKIDILARADEDGYGSIQIKAIVCYIE